MSEDQRIPGSPGDMHLPESGRANYPAASSQYQQAPPYHSAPPTQPSPVPVTNNQTRNIFIGAFATIIASTSVYYLTQYVNNRKAESAPSAMEIKEATYNAWKRYVTMDNIYYKSLRSMAKSNPFPRSPNEFVTYAENIKQETYKLSEDFVTEAETIIKDGSVDKNLKTMLSRRVKREKESGEQMNEYVNSLNAWMNSTSPDTAKTAKLYAIINASRTKSRIMYEIAVTELEDVCKVLSASYQLPFDPSEVLIYSDYRKGVINFEPVNEGSDGLGARATNVSEQSLIGNWQDGDNFINLSRGGLMSYSLITGVKASGRWKLEDDLLRLDVTNNSDVITRSEYFYLYNIRKDTFKMKQTIPPYMIYEAVRVK
jgi:hypothetical protein